MEEPPHPVFKTCANDQPIVQTSQHPEWFSQPRRPPSPDRDWTKTLPAAQGDAQSWISDLARQTDSRSSFNELIDTPIDFSNFIMNRLNVDTLTPELLAGPTYELMRGSCNSLTEIEYHLEEVYKATTDQLDWVNPEGDFKRLRLQDIEDMLLLLVQGKLSNLTIEERLAFNVSLRMFTRSIVIHRRVEDLHLGVESYQKRLNLTKPDTYRTDIRRREFIYQNKDKKNRLMRIDELHKFSDGTLNDVRNTLDDRLKGIRMQYLPTTIWKRGDKDRAANQKDLPMDNPIVSVEVLRYDIKRSKRESKGIVPTEMELVLEQTQQGSSHEVSVRAKGVEELKRIVWIKGVKKEALHTLRQKTGQYIRCQNHKDDC
uniref:MAK10-like protein n=1 Tax=Tanacetum cinerariifolium TaxID=118510 RepID=A0A6L2LF36_TANCI|nr:hypothetical protein [Tanacetum cinerariifolium]